MSLCGSLWGDRGHAPAPLLAAIGKVTLLHTEMAGNLFLFFHEFLAIPGSCRELIFDASHNRARVDLIKHLVADSEASPEEEAAILAALKAYDVATENRNILAHSTLQGPNGRAFDFYKEPTPASPNGWFYRLTTADLVEQAERFEALNYHIVFVWHVIFDRRRGEQTPLPETPPQPRKLSLFRLP
jgi:hypothetical protein